MRHRNVRYYYYYYCLSKIFLIDLEPLLSLSQFLCPSLTLSCITLCFEFVTVPCAPGKDYVHIAVCSLCLTHLLPGHVNNGKKTPNLNIGLFRDTKHVPCSLSYQFQLLWCYFKEIEVKATFLFSLYIFLSGWFCCKLLISQFEYCFYWMRKQHQFERMLNVSAEHLLFIH